MSGDKSVDAEIDCQVSSPPALSPIMSDREPLAYKLFRLGGFLASGMFRCEGART